MSLELARCRLGLSQVVVVFDVDVDSFCFDDDDYQGSGPITLIDMP